MHTSTSSGKSWDTVLGRMYTVLLTLHYEGTLHCDIALNQELTPHFEFTLPCDVTLHCEVTLPSEVTLHCDSV